MGKISTSTRNFSRLILMILDPGTRTLQCLFEKQYSSTGDDLESFLKSKERKVKRLHKKDIITKEQIEHLFPSHGGQPSVQKLDISLLCTLLTNLCTVTKPVMGWSVTPSVTDQSTGADIIRLKTARNKLAHSVNSNVSDADFNHAWTDISGCITRLSNQLDPKERDDIQSQMGRIINDSTENSNGMVFCNIEMILCHIDAKLQALIPDEAEMIVVISDEEEEEEEDAMRAEIPKGEDGKLLLQKRYSYLKEELTKKEGKSISEYLLKKQLINRDVYDRLTDACSSRTSLIDSLLKTVLLGRDTMLENFFEVLKLECPKLAICLANTEVTPEDSKSTS